MKRRLVLSISAALLTTTAGWMVFANPSHFAIENVVCGPGHFPEDDDCHDPTEEAGCQANFFVTGLSFKGFKCSCQIFCEQRPPGGVMPVRKKKERVFGD